MSDNVNFELDGIAVSLDELKSLVANDMMLAALDHIVETSQQELGTARCPIHGETPFVTISISASGDLNISTSTCCEMFAGKTTGPLQRNLNQTAYFKPKSRLIIHVQDASDPLIFNVDSIRSLLIGRTQPNAGEPVDINLHSYDGLNQGVSRQHAEIVWKRGALHIVDRGSANGTYLNDQRLEADEPHILHDGDSLRLGQLRLGILLVDSEK